MITFPPVFSFSALFSALPPDLGTSCIIPSPPGGRTKVRAAADSSALSSIEPLLSLFQSVRGMSVDAFGVISILILSMDPMDTFIPPMDTFIPPIPMSPLRPITSVEKTIQVSIS